MTGRIFEAGHTTAPDPMPERANNRLHPRGRPHTSGPSVVKPRRMSVTPAASQTRVFAPSRACKHALPGSGNRDHADKPRISQANASGS
jgi:hypothetical protein